MPVAFQQFFGLLTTPSGNLIYHLILGFSISAGLPIAFFLWRTNIQPLNYRVVIGLGLLLFLRIGLFFIGGLIWQGVIEQSIWQPVAERIVSMLSISILLWLWVFLQPHRRSDFACLIFFLILLLSSVFLSVWWVGQNNGIALNGSGLDRVLSGFSVLTAVMALFLAGWKRPLQWTSAVLFFLIVLSGYLIQLLRPNTGQDFSPYIRFAELAAYPLLILLPLRFPTDFLYVAKKAIPEAKTMDSKITPNEMALVESGLNLPLAFQEGKLGTALPRLISQAMRADLCLLVSPPDDNSQIILQGGYDLIREHYLEGGNWDGGVFPTLSAALRNGKTLRLYADTATPDLNNLASVLHLDRIGHLLTTAILDEENQPIFGVLLLSPYSDHRWNSEEQDTVVHIAKLISKLLIHLKNQAEIAAQLVEAEQSLIQAHESLAALQQELQIRPMYPPEEIHKSQQSYPLSEQTTLEEELHLALEEIAHLHAELEKAQENLWAIQARAPGLERGTIIANLAAELRQPLASILGYTDFLLGESVGILGSLQRKFLERIRSATQRIESVLGDYLPETGFLSAPALVNVQPVNLSQLIQGLIESTEDQRQSKSQQLECEVPDELPLMQIDATGLEQILHKLLENAIQTTPPQGIVEMKVDLKQDNQQSRYLLIQIQDQGGGISADILPQVFSPARQEIPLGLGVSGVELSIVKAMVEALNGRIWVDSVAESGTTFSILFPFVPGKSTPLEKGEVVE